MRIGIHSFDITFFEPLYSESSWLKYKIAVNYVAFYAVVIISNINVNVGDVKQATFLKQG